MQYTNPNTVEATRSKYMNPYQYCPFTSNTEAYSDECDGAMRTGFFAGMVFLILLCVIIAVIVVWRWISNRKPIMFVITDRTDMLGGRA